jgi:hypothetical protein
MARSLSSASSLRPPAGATQERVELRAAIRCELVGNSGFDARVRRSPSGCDQSQQPIDAGADDLARMEMGATV